MNTEKYDLAIIGAGSVGLIAADFAVKLGARVALMERDRIGGDCTWSGCVPSKSLLKVARVAHQLRTASTLVLHFMNAGYCLGNFPHLALVEMRCNGTG